MSQSTQRAKATEHTFRRFRGAQVPDEPLLSVLTPCANAMPYLEEAIASVEALDKVLAFEHVVADGASKDGSVELLEHAAHVRGISQADDGLYDALNWTLGQARGRYVQWLNADDRVCPEFLIRAVRLLEAHPQLDMVLGSTQFIDSAGRMLGKWSYDPYRALDLWAQAQGYFFNINSAVYRTDLLRSVGDFDQERFPVAADVDYELRLLQQNVQAVVLDEVAYEFRKHRGSITRGEAADETVMQTGIHLADVWSRNEALDVPLRRAFGRRALELRLGWCLKRMRLPGYRKAALIDLVELFFSEPRGVARVAPDWLRKKLAGGFVPMKDH